MSEYKRLTEKKLRDTDIYPVLDENGNVIVDRRLFNRFIEQHNRLAELEDKIEQGTLIELPCKVGDSFYSYEGYKYECLGIEIGRKGIYFRTIYGMRFLFGKEAFLTREEAEKRLKELQE